jgi:hypothetical protein
MGLQVDPTYFNEDMFSGWGTVRETAKLALVNHSPLDTAHKIQLIGRSFLVKTLGWVNYDKTGFPKIMESS